MTGDSKTGRSSELAHRLAHKQTTDLFFLAASSHPHHLKNTLVLYCTMDAIEAYVQAQFAALKGIYHSPFNHDHS